MASHYDEVGVKVLRAQQALAEIRGLARVGGVTIEVDSKGHLQAISVDTQAVAAGPSGLSDLILYAYRQAVQDAEPRAAAAMQELMDDPQVARVVDMTVQPDVLPIPMVQPSTPQPGGPDTRRTTPTATSRVDSPPRAPLSPPPASTTSTGPATTRNDDDWDEEDDYYARKRRQGWLEH
ncbi:YbaB/EbfC family nucleoid-associated protein [Nocardia anaemiae]|uniref:YbaB/EbfC family nucleoid-associated protein n=1 Tax=Nocardia anaemiae TaxID=263910 RepID=UPI0007A3FC52|nr:YbaB/EbfC family nucleoid-associated protein [Nocardia anaemiae]